MDLHIVSLSQVLVEDLMNVGGIIWFSSGVDFALSQSELNIKALVQE